MDIKSKEQVGMKQGYRYKKTICHICKMEIYENVIIRHLKSGCKYGNIAKGVTEENKKAQRLTAQEILWRTETGKIQVHKIIAESMTESALFHDITKLAGVLGWKHYHTWNSIKSDPGFPDLVLVRPPRLLFVELKAEGGKLTEAQEDWMRILAGCNQEWQVWRPSDWLSGRIEKVLKGEK